MPLIDTTGHRIHPISETNLHPDSGELNIWRSEDTVHRIANDLLIFQSIERNKK